MRRRCRRRDNWRLLPDVPAALPTGQALDEIVSSAPDSRCGRAVAVGPGKGHRRPADAGLTPLRDGPELAGAAPVPAIAAELGLIM
jgi:hypothetical protein